MERQSTNSSDWLSWYEITTAAEIAAAILVLCIIVAEWLAVLISLWNQATVR
jgi:hypothetical protein